MDTQQTFNKYFMDDRSLTSAQYLQTQVASLLLYQSAFNSEIGEAFLALLQTISRKDCDGLDCLKAYGRWFQALATQNQSWQDYLIAQILEADNPFTQRLQTADPQASLSSLPPHLITAAKHDLQVLQGVHALDGDRIGAWVQEAAHLSAPPVVWQAETTGINPFSQYENWADALPTLADRYLRSGAGIFARDRAFRWQSGKLVGIAHPDPVRLSDLASYESQRDTLVKNTEFLLSGYPAQHVLLYGSRGSGKSSLVKALLNEYGDRGLRLIEVTKSDLQELPAINEQLRHLSLKFIIFVDDLSFEEDENAYKALKVVLEGNLTAKPENVAVYATSNRRHLIREYFSDRPRPSEEVHAWDTVQEKLSFSDRFGLTLTFIPPDRDTYLQIVNHLAAQARISLSPEDLEYRALQWATRHNGRSGRTARQFIDFLYSELAIAANNPMR